jgi:PAS domain S-box-containing protein
MGGSNVMVLGCDADGRVRVTSPEFLDLTGLSPARVIGRTIAELSAGDADDRLRVELADGTTFEFETSRCRLTEAGQELADIVVLTPVADPVARAAALGVNLSEREGQILGYAADGYRVATIARELYISPSTVRNHLSAIFKKLGVANQAQLLEKLNRA